MKAIGRATHVLAVAACLGSAARAQLAAREPQAYMRKVGFQDGEIADLPTPTRRRPSC